MNGAAEKLPVIALLAAVLVNMSMGIIYVWGLFLLPLEEYLAISRDTLSVVPALALASFTVGMMLHDWVLRRIGDAGLGIVAFVLAGGGHLGFAAAHSYPSLVVGYGLAFGLGAGLGYGLALALASRASDKNRGLAIGIATSAFAFSGVVFPILLGPWIRASAPPESFMSIGGALLVTGIVAVAIVWSLRSGKGRADAVDIVARDPVRVLDRNFLALAISFFLLCFVGLVVVSHGLGIVAANGLPARTGELSLTLFTVGYVLGSLFGGRFIEIAGGTATIILVSIMSAAGIWFLDSSGSAVVLTSAVIMGIAFGSSASFMPTLVGKHYGAHRIGEVYSKLILSYGLAGLSAPWVAGALFARFGTYTSAIQLSLAMCVLAALMGVILKRPAA